MSSRSPYSRPGIPGQTVARLTFRALGILITGAALVLLVVGGMDFFTAFGTFGRPTKFWMLFVGIPMLAVGGWCLQAGFMGVGSRYVAGEVAPVARDTAAYLTDGRGLMNIGGPGTASGSLATGPYCRSCGTRNDAEARFCDSCGTAMA